jgi:tRNA/tmRNA/rRNA uracil-C5-methylase (TrmA/RlmC/RlmD family)
VEFAVNRAGRAGLHGHRSRQIVPVDDCLIATEAVVASGVLDTDWQGCTAVDVIDAAHPDEPVLVALPIRRGADEGGGVVGERVTDGAWEGEYVVSARGFWQVHPGAASTFLSRVVALLEPAPGERVLDLYAGSGLFTMRLGELVAPGGVVLAVEGDALAVSNGLLNTEGQDNVEWRTNRVEHELGSLVSQGITADVVVLDPPRTGAGPGVIGHLAAMRPRRLVYVACDPAALARDVRASVDHGFRLTHLEAWDAFPMTHHVECIAVLEPAG